MRTPIDIYRAKNIIDIYIELSKVDNKYSLNVTGLKNKMSLLLKSRALCYEILKDVYNMKISRVFLAGRFCMIWMSCKNVVDNETQSQ